MKAYDRLRQGILRDSTAMRHACRKERAFFLRGAVETLSSVVRGARCLPPVAEEGQSTQASPKGSQSRGREPSGSRVVRGGVGDGYQDAFWALWREWPTSLWKVALSLPPMSRLSDQELS